MIFIKILHLSNLHLVWPRIFCKTLANTLRNWQNKQTNKQTNKQANKQRRNFKQT